MRAVPSSGRHRLRWLGIGVLVTALVLGVGVGLRLRSNITVVDVSDALAAEDDAGDPTPVAGTRRPGRPLNILVMGSDTRVGQGDGFGSARLIEGARSDTTLLVHLAADRQSVTVVSIPRDLVVQLPACRLADGSRSYPYDDRFNAAFSIGGPECTIRTATQLTGLPIHHYVVVDFSSFRRTVDALGGVDVCLVNPVDDPKAGLDLPAGVSRVDGEQALAFVRARTSLGDGSDLARIERQQAFLGSLVREATSRELLTDPVRLLRSLDAATGSLTMDAGLASLPRSVSLARSLAGVDPSRVSFVTLPNVYSDDFITVRPDEARMRLLVDVLAADLPWPFPPAEGRAPARPRDVSVAVVDATGRAGQGAQVGTALTEQAFTVTAVTPGAVRSRSQVVFPPGQQQAARTVAAALGGVPVRRDAQVSAVTLELGRSYGLADLRTVRPPRPATSWSPSTDGGLPTGRTTTAQTATCAQ
jgi:LCP family protein required for cell wall assembly